MNPSSTGIAAIYDLRDPEAWKQAHRHRSLWGKRLTDYHFLDENYVVLVFRPGGAKWLKWEEVRKQMVFGEGAA